MRNLALGLTVAASALIVAMLAVTAATGVTQEQYEYVAAHYTFEHAGATRLLFAIDLAFLVTYTWMFVALARYLASRGASRLIVGVALGALVVTALLDIVEDHHILSLLALTEAGGQPSDGMLTFQQTLSATKFALSTLGLVGFGLAIPRTRTLGWVLSGFLVIGTVATIVINAAAPPDMHHSLDGGRWWGFLAGFVLAATWLKTETDS